MTVESPAAAAWPNAKPVAIACGVGAAACWALGLIAARHGIAIGLTPMDLAFHRFMWSGLFMLHSAGAGASAISAGSVGAWALP